MSYITFALPHLQAIRSWVKACAGTATVDVLSFELKLKAHDRSFTLYPQFIALVGGQLSYVNELVPQVTGFAGWLPYQRPLRWPLWQNKLEFKEALSLTSFATPAYAPVGQRIDFDYVLKAAVGSFGKEVFGPFHPSESPIRVQTKSQLFAEQFVLGKSLKVWFWGHKPFYAQVHEPAKLVGDGQRDVQTLLAAKLLAIGQRLATYAEMDFVKQALRYQGVNLETVLQGQQAVWLDFRYGRLFAPWAATEQQDNRWSQLGAAVQTELHAMGRFVAEQLKKALKPPVLYAVDAVLDDEERVWYLEVNSSPTLPPAGYPLVLSTLFDSPAVGIEAQS